MLPVLAEFGPFTLYTLWIFVSAGIIVGTLLFLKRAKYQRMDVEFLLNHSLSLLLSSMVISRLGFFITSWGYFGPFSFGNTLKQILMFWQPGYSFWGAVAGFTLMLAFHCRKEGQKLLNWIEVMIVPFFTGIILGNIGQFFDGQGYGHDTILPWGVTFTSTNVKYTVPIHPTQLYSIILILIILLSRKKLTQKWEHLKNDTDWTLFIITFYSFARFWLEFLRGDDTLEWGWLRFGHLVSGIVFVSMAILLYKRWRPHKKSKN